MEYSPPTTEIDVGTLMPVTVIVLEVITAFNGTPVWSMRTNGLGTVSGTGLISTVTVAESLA
jgi:hypothetical protein